MSYKFHFIFKFIPAVLVIWLFNSACHKEIFTSDPGKQLRIEQDTLTFDTVFTTIGSATRYLKIFNDNDQSISIDMAFIPNGNQSDFKMNLDGLKGNNLHTIEIHAHDSIYLFCEVTVHPNDPLEVSPLIKTDSIILKYNGTQQKIILIAWGQNANYFPSKSNKGQVVTIDLNGSTLEWNDAKPYILYGIMYIDNGTLVISDNTKIYVWGGLTKATDQSGNTFFYNDGRIIIGPKASLKVKGTKERPVIFQGVRLEASFQNVPGQWSGIFLDKMSQGNEIKYAVIKNNLIGLVADSLSSCTIEETKIFNNSLYGVYASTANLEINNSLIYNQGSSGLLFNTGGNYEVNFCTIMNVGNSDPAVYLSNSRCIDFPFCEVNYEFPLKGLIRNCIITGSDDDELYMADKSSSGFDPFFQNCLFKIKELTNQFPEFYSKYTKDCIPSDVYYNLFKDFNNGDFHLDTLSILDKKAIPVSKILFDLDGIPRDPINPDIGCYEHVN